MLPPGFDPANVRAIATDLDGTILDGVTFRPSPRMIAAIRAAEASGIHIILATGRMFQSARRIAHELHVHGPIICYQGGLVADADSGEVLLHTPLEVELAREILHALGPHARTTNAYVDDELYVTEANAGGHPLRRDRRRRDARRRRARGVADATHDQARHGRRSPSGSIRCATRCRRASATRAFVAKSLPIFLEFAAANVSKSAALAFLGRRLGFTAAQCVSFGDGENDRDLLSWAGLGVCVANATPLLKSEADWVVPSVTDGGVAQFLEELVAARGAA